MSHGYAIFLIKQEIEQIKKDLKRKYANNSDELALALSFNSDIKELENSLKALVNK